MLNILNTDFQKVVVDAVEQPSEPSLDGQRIAAIYQKTLGLSVADQIQKQEQSPIRPRSKNPHAPSEFRKTVVLTRRAVLTLLRDPVAFWIRLLMNVVVTVITGSIWWRLDRTIENLPSLYGGIFFVVLAACFDALTAITTSMCYSLYYSLQLRF